MTASANMASFDPQSVPFLPQQNVLPVVPAAHLSVDALRQRFVRPPLWQPEPMVEKPWFDKPLAPSAVLIPLVMREQLHVLLTQRTATLSNHSGQIAFPGGRVDTADADAVACALREAHEEIGLPAKKIEVLGELPPYITGTAFCVTPVVALVQADYPLAINAAEVSEVFEISLAHLLNPQEHQLQEWRMGERARQWFSIPSVDASGTPRYVWGATAGMLRNLYRFILPALL